MSLHPRKTLIAFFATGVLLTNSPTPLKAFDFIAFGVMAGVVVGLGGLVAVCFKCERMFINYYMIRHNAAPSRNPNDLDLERQQRLPLLPERRVEEPGE